MQSERESKDTCAFVLEANPDPRRFKPTHRQSNASSSRLALQVFCNYLCDGLLHRCRAPNLARRLDVARISKSQEVVTSSALFSAGLSSPPRRPYPPYELIGWSLRRCRRVGCRLAPTDCGCSLSTIRFAADASPLGPRRPEHTITS